MLKPWYLKGFLLLTKMVPFIPPGPYNADEAPGKSSMPSTSNEVAPTKLPTEKFKPGAWLSIPSINWLTRALPLPLKPLVEGVVNVKLEVITSTPFKFFRASCGLMDGVDSIILAPSFSTVMADCTLLVATLPGASTIGSSMPTRALRLIFSSSKLVTCCSYVSILT